MEIWKDIKGYGNKYQVSNTGLVRNKITGRIRKQNMTAKGKLQVSLSEGAISDNFLVNKLVATYFVPNEKDYYYVINKDGNKMNVNADNLEWVETNVNAHKILSKKVVKMDLSGKVLEIYNSASEAAKKNFCSHSTLARACKNELKSLGFLWKYQN